MVGFCPLFSISYLFSPRDISDKDSVGNDLRYCVTLDECEPKGDEVLGNDLLALSTNASNSFSGTEATEATDLGGLKARFPPGSRSKGAELGSSRMPQPRGSRLLVENQV